MNVPFSATVNRDQGPQRDAVVGRDRLSRLKPAERFFQSKLAKRVLRVLQQAKRDRQAQVGQFEPPKEDEEGGLAQSLGGSKVAGANGYGGPPMFPPVKPPVAKGAAKSDEYQIPDYDIEDPSDDSETEVKPQLRKKPSNNRHKPASWSPKIGKAESLIGWVIEGRMSLTEAVGLLDPSTVNYEGEYQPSMDEYFDAMILRVNSLDLLDFYLTSSIEDELDAILMFFDSSMEESQAARLLASFREILPGAQVIQRPEDGCWVFLATESEIDVLGTADNAPPQRGTDSGSLDSQDRKGGSAKQASAFDSEEFGGGSYGGLGALPPSPSEKGQLVSAPGPGKRGAGGLGTEEEEAPEGEEEEQEGGLRGGTQQLAPPTGEEETLGGEELEEPNLPGYSELEAPETGLETPEAETEPEQSEAEPEQSETEPERPGANRMPPAALRRYRRESLKRIESDKLIEELLGL